MRNDEKFHHAVFPVTRRAKQRSERRRNQTLRQTLGQRQDGHRNVTEDINISSLPCPRPSVLSVSQTVGEPPSIFPRPRPLPPSFSGRTIHEAAGHIVDVVLPLQCHQRTLKGRYVHTGVTLMRHECKMKATRGSGPSTDLYAGILGSEGVSVWARTAPGALIHVCVAV